MLTALDFYSLHGCFRAIHCASVALAHASVVVFSVTGPELGESLTLIPRVAHHILSDSASLLDGRLQVLIGLLLDGLCIL